MAHQYYAMQLLSFSSGSASIVIVLEMALGIFSCSEVPKDVRVSLWPEAFIHVRSKLGVYDGTSYMTRLLDSSNPLSEFSIFETVTISQDSSVIEIPSLLNSGI
jgi:hypothetical protein